MNNLRGISPKLISAFKNSELYKLSKDSPKILACIRDNAIGLYYNADRVAMISLDNQRKLQCKINSYYISDYYLYKNKRTPGKEETHTPKSICDSFEKIKRNSEKRSTPEKKAQQALFYANNSNPNSKWICLDIEYKQSQKAQGGLTDPFTGRFDIIALSKAKPYRIAIIELKYNKKSIGGDSGVVKHLRDFYKFNNDKCISNLKEEIKMELENLSKLELLNNSISINDIEKDCAKGLEFYIICLYDTKVSPRGTVGGYLFNEIHPEWGTKRVSTKNAENELSLEEYSILNEVKFLFKHVPTPTDICINDILDIDNYEK